MNRTASVSGADRTDSLSFSGSNSQLNSSSPLQQYTPDFYVRALTDLQFVKVGLASVFSLRRQRSICTTSPRSHRSPGPSTRTA